jgi:hypothetical protein
MGHLRLSGVSGRGTVEFLKVGDIRENPRTETLLRGCTAILSARFIERRKT